MLTEDLDYNYCDICILLVEALEKIKRRMITSYVVLSNCIQVVICAVEYISKFVLLFWCNVICDFEHVLQRSGIRCAVCCVFLGLN